MDVYNRRPQGEGAECRGRERAPGFSNLGRDPDLPSCRQLPSVTLFHLDMPVVTMASLYTYVSRVYLYSSLYGAVCKEVDKNLTLDLNIAAALTNGHVGLLPVPPRTPINMQPPSIGLRIEKVSPQMACSYKPK